MGVRLVALTVCWLDVGIAELSIADGHARIKDWAIGLAKRHVVGSDARTVFLEAVKLARKEPAVAFTSFGLSCDNVVFIVEPRAARFKVTRTPLGGETGDEVVESVVDAESVARELGGTQGPCHSYAVMKDEWKVIFLTEGGTRSLKSFVSHGKDIVYGYGAAPE
jgi:hypothetical protein